MEGQEKQGEQERLYTLLTEHAGPGSDHRVVSGSGLDKRDW